MTELMLGRTETDKKGDGQGEGIQPISNPFVAGIDSIAWASFASSLSKQGSPRPNRCQISAIIAWYDIAHLRGDYTPRK